MNKDFEYPLAQEVHFLPESIQFEDTVPLKKGNSVVATLKGTQVSKSTRLTNDNEIRALKQASSWKATAIGPEPLIALTYYGTKKSKRIAEQLPEPKPASFLFAEDNGSPPDPSWVTEDVGALNAGINPKAIEYNKQFWSLYNFENIQPLTGVSAVQTPRLFANKVREGQTLFAKYNYGINGVRIMPDGILGYRTLVLLAIIAGDLKYVPNLKLRHELAGLGFNMKALGSNEARPAIKRAWTILAPLHFRDVWTLSIKGRAAVRILNYREENTAWGQEFFSKESLKEFMDYVLFMGNPPAWLRSDEDLKIRMDLLYKSFKEGETVEVKAALVSARRDFLHNYWDQTTFFQEKIKTLPPNHTRMWRVLNRWSKDVKEIIGEKAVDVKNLTTVPGEKWEETTGVLVQYFMPVKNVDVTATLLKFRSEISSLAYRLLDLLRLDQYRYIKANRVAEFLTGLPVNTTFGELFYDEVAKQFSKPEEANNGVSRMISMVEKLASESVFGMLIRLASGGKYEKDPAMVRLGKSLEKLREATRQHEYITTGTGKGVRLQKKIFVGLGEVTSSAFRLSKTETGLKKERAAAVVKRVRELFEQALDEARKAGGKPYSLQDKTPDQILEELVNQAKKELNIGDSDAVEMEYEEGFRILDVQETETRGVKHIRVRYERVYRLEQGGEYHSDNPIRQKALDREGWQAMDGHEKDKVVFRSQAEFEEDLGWVYFSNYMKATAKVVSVIAIVGTAPVFVAVSAAVGFKLLVFSISLSVGFYVGKVIFTDEEFSGEGFLNAVIEGYVGALGMRIFLPFGGALAKLLSSKGGGFGLKLAQYAFKTAVSGGGTGAFTLVGSQFLEDILMHDRMSDAAVYIARAKAGFCFGFLFEFAGTPIMKQFGKALAPSLARIKELSAKEIWKIAKTKLTKEELTGLPKKLFETAQEIKVKLDIKADSLFNHPQLAGAMMSKTQSVLKELFLAVREAPAIYLKEFEIVVYENAMFLAEKNLLPGAEKGLEKLIRTARATGMKAAEINDTVNLFLKTSDDRLVNAWLQMINETDQTLLNQMLRKEVKNLALTVNILQLRALVGNQSVTGVFLFHFNASTKAFGEFAGALLAMGEGKAKLIIDLLFNKGRAVSPEVLLSLLQRKSSLDQAVVFGLERLGRGGVRLNLDLEQLLKSVPDGKLDSFLRSVGLLSEPELGQLLKLYARKDKALLDYLAHVSDDPAKLKSMLSVPAKVATGAVPPPLPKSIASSKAFQPTGKPQAGTGLVPGKVNKLPRRTVFVAPQATSEADAIQMFMRTYRADPLREVAIYQNTETGEFIIIQGERDMVSMGPGDPGFGKAVKEVLDHNLGNWQLRGHSHPIDKTTKEVLLADRYPSGNNGDFGLLVYESAKAGRTARSSSIFYLTKDGIEQTIFTFNPRSLLKRYEIDIPAPGSGKRVTKSFMSMRGYRRWFKKEFKIDLDPPQATISKIKSTVTRSTLTAEQDAIVKKIFDPSGGFVESKLAALYKKYAAAKTPLLKPGEKLLTPAEWILVTRGEARKVLDNTLGQDWRTHFRAAKQYSSRMQGEISVEVTGSLLSKLKPYPAGEFGDPPFDIGDRLTLGPSIERIDTDLMRKDFLDELQRGTLNHIDENIVLDFLKTVQKPVVGVNVVDLGPRPGGGRYYWPLDDVGATWQLHHIWPLEWNGPDILMNLMPLRYRDHQGLHDWWTALKKWVLDDWEARLARKADMQVEIK